ncbi:MAG: UDP-N-acetylmuramoyl-L-alanyl-D-glutamate--2,6-diaminopimelate ligase [Clostridia bacterium]|nr:UDP-N-acetylmuramoyl-L-alanyl-D-glutamate--2,6-diaminopimelate ligase [Clostridia bacterium]
MRLDTLVSPFPVALPDAFPGDAEIERIEYDSRRADAGCLFVCMPGARTDGHDFARFAYEAGCRCFLAEHKVDLPADAAQIIADDTRALLPALSARFYGNPADKLELIGITGTKGKTTTALLTTAILNSAGIPTAYVGSNGVIIRDTRIETANTTPESRDIHMYFRAMVAAGIRVAVLEVSSQALAHHRTDGLRFAATAYLNLSEDHIGPSEHKDFDDYMAAKARLFSDFSSDVTVYNADDAYAARVLAGCRAPKISYSMRGDADFSGFSPVSYREDGVLGVAFDCLANGKTTHVWLRSPGDFSVYNALCAIALCRRFGVSVETAAEALRETSVLGRFEIVDALPDRTFIVDYAHNGLSLTKALSVLRQYEPRRLICVFGSVGGRTKGRREELGRAAAALADYSIITSDNPDFEDPEAIMRDIASYFSEDAPHEMIADRGEAIRRAVEISAPGDIVLFAGKGHESYQLVEGKKLPFSERDIIRRAAAELPVAGR